MSPSFPLFPLLCHILFLFRVGSPSLLSSCQASFWYSGHVLFPFSFPFAMSFSPHSLIVLMLASVCPTTLPAPPTLSASPSKSSLCYRLFASPCQHHPCNRLHNILFLPHLANLTLSVLPCHPHPVTLTLLPSPCHPHHVSHHPANLTHSSSPCNLHPATVTTPTFTLPLSPCHPHPATYFNLVIFICHPSPCQFSSC